METLRTGWDRRLTFLVLVHVDDAPPGPSRLEAGGLATVERRAFALEAPLFTFDVDLAYGKYRWAAVFGADAGPDASATQLVSRFILLSLPFSFHAETLSAVNLLAPLLKGWFVDWPYAVRADRGWIQTSPD